MILNQGTSIKDLMIIKGPATMKDLKILIPKGLTILNLNHSNLIEINLNNFIKLNHPTNLMNNNNKPWRQINSLKFHKHHNYNPLAISNKLRMNKSLINW